MAQRYPRTSASVGRAEAARQAAIKDFKHVVARAKGETVIETATDVYKAARTVADPFFGKPEIANAIYSVLERVEAGRSTLADAIYCLRSCVEEADRNLAKNRTYSCGIVQHKGADVDEAYLQLHERIEAARTVCRMANVYSPLLWPEREREARARLLSYAVVTYADEGTWRLLHDDGQNVAPVCGADLQPIIYVTEDAAWEAYAAAFSSVK